ncbi:hypothetical protein [Vibrio mytili]|uniref:Uncharacterized protein n=1 Tax=Vibrio mytili TaxID=50718 RepID=A0A0C3HS44_9VIBR|nr:hypothetical protein [Vibrio mytili]KIN11011.1 hypothetical protein SU60_09585 [Vibrio mytili]
MEQILLNLSSTDWWFTGLFFALLGSFLPKIISIIWKRSVEHLPSLVRGFNRTLRFNLLVNVRKHRDEDHFITWVICRYWLGCFMSLMLALSIAGIYALNSLEAILPYRGHLLFVVVFIAILNQLIFRQKNFIFSLITQNKKVKKWKSVGRNVKQSV